MKEEEVLMPFHIKNKSKLKSTSAKKEEEGQEARMN